MNIDALALQSASTMAPHVDKAMLALLLICGSAFIIIFALMLFFSIRYRENSNHARQFKKHNHSILEWTWTLGSLVIFLGIFGYGAMIYFEMHVAPPDAAEITVVGKQWMWKFQHKNGLREINELHVPIGQPIFLTMISEDVIHSVFVPDFRLKQDVLPGRYTRTWFEASKTGEYRLYCTQYCGTMHADMIGRVIVLSEENYEKWLQKGATSGINEIPQTMNARGEKLFEKLGCISCHSQNKEKLGPSLQGLFGSKIKLASGATIMADESYIRESILSPDTKIRRGFKTFMPPYMGRISEDELLDLIAYIKSL